MMLKRKLISYLDQLWVEEWWGVWWSEVRWRQVDL